MIKADFAKIINFAYLPLSLLTLNTFSHLSYKFKAFPLIDADSWFSPFLPLFFSSPPFSFSLGLSHLNLSSPKRSRIRRETAQDLNRATFERPPISILCCTHRLVLKNTRWTAWMKQLLRLRLHLSRSLHNQICNIIAWRITALLRRITVVDTILALK